jgi:ABC-type lipoprotein export system ATPase subunit
METEGEKLPLLSIRDVHKRYGTTAVLRGISLQLQRAERVAVMGASGSGKSTLLHCVAGLEIPDSGSIRFRGQEITTMSEHQRARLRRAKITSVFQFFHLLPTLTAAANVGFPLLLEGKLSAKERDGRVRQLLEEVGLSDRADSYPASLSGGEMQRLAIARALITDPELILADEPTGSLDSANGARILELLRQLTRSHGTALLMVTHDADAARSCDRILQMRDGHWIAAA